MSEIKTAEEFLTPYHNNRSNDWMFIHKDVIEKLLDFYASQYKAKVDELKKRFEESEDDLEAYKTVNREIRDYLKLSPGQSIIEVIKNLYSELTSLKQEKERLVEALKFTKEKVDGLECKCDDYNGFTCGLHNWRDKVDYALSSLSKQNK